MRDKYKNLVTGEFTLDMQVAADWFTAGQGVYGVLGQKENSAEEFRRQAASWKSAVENMTGTSIIDNLVKKDYLKSEALCNSIADLYEQDVAVDMTEPICSDRATWDEVIEEGVHRMELLKIDHKCIALFQHHGKVYISADAAGYYSDFLGAYGKSYCAVDGVENWTGRSVFEKEHTVLVYHVIRNLTPWGSTNSFLYVDPATKAEWSFERRCIEQGVPDAWTVNCAKPGSAGEATRLTVTRAEHGGLALAPDQARRHLWVAGKELF